MDELVVWGIEKEYLKMRNDGIHMHVDAGGNGGLVENIVMHLRARGYATKIHRVDASAAGPQRAKLPQVYSIHNPTAGGVEVFDYFSTTTLASREELIAVAKETLGLLKDARGVVIEAEQVMGALSERSLHEARNLVEPLTCLDITPAPVITETLIEVHHKVDLPKSENLPFSARELCDLCGCAGVELGGAFIFHDEQLVKYRTNAFFRPGDPLKIEEQYEVIGNIIRKRNPLFQQEVIWERVLGIWSC